MTAFYTHRQWLHIGPMFFYLYNSFGNYIRFEMKKESLAKNVHGCVLGQPIPDSTFAGG